MNINLSSTIIDQAIAAHILQNKGPAENMELRMNISQRIVQNVGELVVATIVKKAKSYNFL